MKVIDLVHIISENMPVYPGTEGPKLIFLELFFKKYVDRCRKIM
jgi:kynurenine formamidase